MKAHGPDSSLRIARGIARSISSNSESSKPRGITVANETENGSSSFESDGSDAIEVMVSYRDEKISRKHRFEGPFVLIGRSSDCDLNLQDDHVSTRHAYLQKIRGRIVCVDLASSNGTYWPDGRRPFGWFDNENSIDIGAYHLRLLSPIGNAEIKEPEFDPGSFFKSASQEPDYPEISLQNLSASGAAETWTLNRTITLVGESSCCKLRLSHESVSRVHCSLVLLPEGLWAFDLRSKTGTFVNEEKVCSHRFRDGDVLRVGNYAFRIKYLYREVSSESSQELATANALAGKVISNELAGQMMDQMMAMQQQYLQHSQQQTEMMLQFFSTMQSQQYELLNREMARVHEIEKELRELRTAMSPQASQKPNRATGSPPPSGDESVKGSKETDRRRLPHIRTAGAAASQSNQDIKSKSTNSPTAQKSTKPSKRTRKRKKTKAQRKRPTPPASDAATESTDQESFGIGIAPDASETQQPQQSGQPAQKAAADEFVTSEMLGSEKELVTSETSGTAEDVVISEMSEAAQEVEASEMLVSAEREEGTEDLGTASEPPVQHDEIDEHVWLLSRMHDLERERDGIFRRMAKSIFKSNR